MIGSRALLSATWALERADPTRFPIGAELACQRRDGGWRGLRDAHSRPDYSVAKILQPMQYYRI
jgi:hypothetical protein